MGEVFKGLVEIQNAANARTIQLNGDHAGIVAGGNGEDGDLVLMDNDGNQRLWVDGQKGYIVIHNTAGNLVLRFDASAAALYIGCKGNEGNIYVRDGAGRYVFKFDASAAALNIGSEDNGGDILVRDMDGRIVFRFSSQNALLKIGAAGNEGDLEIYNDAGDSTFKVDGNEGDISVRRRIDGVLRAVMKFDASSAALNIGSKGNEGDISVQDGAGKTVFNFNGSTAALKIGAVGNEGDIYVRDGSGNNRIHLDGNTGDIKLQGADCAEEFDVAEIEKIDPGTVLVIDGESKLQPCKESYDKKVAGVVSGANGSNPGIILDKNPAQTKRLPIALNGKVHCKADAQYSPIEVGDLLTTSPTDGHAMKAEEPLKAFGAVIGKALRPLSEGKGMIPILVALQ